MLLRLAILWPERSLPKGYVRRRCYTVFGGWNYGQCVYIRWGRMEVDKLEISLFQGSNY